MYPKKNLQIFSASLIKETLFYMATRFNMFNVKCYGDDYVQKVNKAVAGIFEFAYPNDDMEYESL